eukprot:812338-Amphidinium_carterae.1
MDTCASCQKPVWLAIARINGDGPLPPPPALKAPPAKISASARTSRAEKAAMKSWQGKLPPTKGFWESHVNQVMERAKARQGKQPPIKGSAEHLMNVMTTTAPAKPPPGFPPGTSVPKGFTVLAGGRMLYQPGLLPGNMLLSQSEAIKLALQGIPTNVSSQVLTENGQVMIAITPPGGVMSAGSTIDPRWGQPSGVVLKHKCHFCQATDAPQRQLTLCWYEDATGRKCGKRFCFNSHKKCGAQVAYNIKPPSASGVKDFPDCLWCKEHDHIVLPHDGYKHKIGAREDW